ncbi:MFS transporter [Paraburkholderia aspalathi]|uniref:MFS transporter n=1 Tax=Paraburkholderia aspalathi TaxID=1324617 RepID=UPI0038BDF0E4
MNLTNHPRLTLFATSISYVVVVLDTSIVNVALARISQGLGIDVRGLQWVVNAYVVIFASLLLSGGALGDMFGARKIYILGLAMFTVSSLLCGCAPTLPLLIAGRILQGVGASLLVPCSLSLLTHAYPDGKQRAKAIASWASWGGVALVLGPLAGGALLVVFDWRSIFLVNVPVGLLGIWLTLKTDSPVESHGGRRLDLLGQLTAATAMILVTAGLIEGGQYGYGNVWILAAFAIAALSAIAFVVVERKTRAPMLPLFLFANPVFSWICYIFMSGSAAFFGMIFVLSLYFQRIAGLTPLQTGVALLPLSLCVMAGNIASARLAHKIDPMNLMFAGAAIRLVGFACVAFVSADYSYIFIAPLLLLIGFGGGLGSPMSTSVFMSTVDRQYSGIASGVSRATGQIGSAIGVAIFGGLVANMHQIAQGMRIAATISTVLTASIVLIVWYLFRRSSRAVC